MKLKSKTTLYSFLLLVGLGLIIGFLIFPLWSNVESKSSQLKQKQKKLAEVEAQNRRLNNLQQTLQKREEDFKALDNLFINKEAPVQFLEFLEDTAADSNVEIDISPSAGNKSDEPWPPTFFKVEGVGDFEDCIKFATKLEYLPYLVEVQSLNLEKKVETKENEEKIQKTKINLSIKVY